ncbi:MAG: hypothetical protein H0X46_08810, partial [Bacteroidetes bacterium]|nr:hypothetical protein [Bacteroidota bacterium]
KNVSDKELENNSIKLFINDVQKTPASFNIEAGGETEVILSFASRETGIRYCRIEINDYPVTFDDQFYFSFEVSKNISVLSINGGQELSESSYLNKLFASDSLFIFKNMKENNLDYSLLSSSNLIILNELKAVPSGLAQELKRFMQNGGSVLVFPNKEAELNSYKDFFATVRANYFERMDTSNTKVDKINLEHFIYKDVFDKKTFSATNLDLPKVYEHFSLSRTTRSNEEYLLKMQNGETFLSKYDVEKGKLYICAAGLGDNFTNFAKHGIFVPTLYKIAMYSMNSQPLFYTIGNNEVIEHNGIISGENVFRIKSKSSKFEIIPEHKALDFKTVILVHDQIKEAGNYDLAVNTETVSGLSFNFNRKESDLTALNSDELKQEIINSNLINIKVLDIDSKSITQSLMEVSQGIKLWKFCIILTLLFLAIEVLLLRFMKG